MKLIDITGQRFGRLTATERTVDNPTGGPQWKVICDCGTTGVVRSASLRNGDTKSCGCLHRELSGVPGRHGNIDLAGKRFGRLLVVGRAPHIKWTRVFWNVLCDCGVVKKVSKSSLLNGAATSCGCLSRELTAKRTLKRDFEGIYNILLRVAAARQYIIDLTYEEYVEFTNIPECFYCGLTLTWVKNTGKAKSKAYNLDRKDNTLGYTKDNCIPCCPRCNRGKSSCFSFDEWVMVGKALKEFRENTCQS